MTSWGETFLGVIALATLLSALFQAAVLIGAAIAVKRVGELVTKIEARLEPTVARVEALGAQLSLVAESAVVQVAKVERVVDNITHQANRASGTIRAVVKEGDAVAAGARAVVSRLVNHSMD